MCYLYSMNYMEQKKQGKAVGVILTYNCAHLVEGLIRRIPRDALDEIIIVDDSTRDQNETGAIAAKYDIPFFPQHCVGYGGNLKYGLRKAIERGAAFAIEIHGDGQFDPSGIPLTVEKLRGGADFVMGSRFTNWKQPLRDGMPLIRFIANIMLSTIARTVLRIPWSEYHSGFRAYSGRLINAVGNKGADNHIFSFQIIALARFHNMKFDEIPIRANYRDEHTSVGLPEAAVYFFQVFIVLSQYVLARLGAKSDLFKE